MYTPAMTFTRLEDEMTKKTEPKVLIKLRGNVRNYESGQEIEVSEAEAIELLSLGYAIKIEAPAKAEE